MSRHDGSMPEEMNIFVWGGGGNVGEYQSSSSIDGADDKRFEVLLKPVQCRPLRGMGENEEEQESLSLRDVSISAGYCHGALTVDGRVYIAGCSGNGWAGQEALQSIRQWRRLDLQPNAQVVSVSAGLQHTLALDRSGHVYSCGFGSDGALGHGNSDDIWALRRIEKKFSDAAIKSISAGGRHSMAMADDGAVYVWGCGKDGRLGLSRSEQSLGWQIQNPTDNTTSLSELEPRRLPLPFPCAMMISAGHDSSCVVSAHDKRLYSFGCAKGGVLGPSVDENIHWPEASTFLKDNEISYVDIGRQIAIAKVADGRLLAWGAALSKLYNLKSRTLHVLRIPPEWGSVETVSCGDSAAIGICKTQQGATKLWTFGLSHAPGMRAAFPTDCDPSNSVGHCCSVAAGASYFYAVYRPTEIPEERPPERRLNTLLGVDVSESSGKSVFAGSASSGLPTNTEVARDEHKDATQRGLEQERLAIGAEEVEEGLF